MPQHLARVVDLGAREPLRARHGATGQHGRVRRGGLQVKVVPDALPEGRQVVHRPAPQRIIGIKRKAACLAQPLLVQGDLGDVGGGHVQSISLGSGTLCARDKVERLYLFMLQEITRATR
jgi:hypothetical protein